jgi:hypothetical protein
MFAAACRATELQSEFRPKATVKDIMDSMIDPSADFLWNAVSTTISVRGIQEKQPRTDEEWLDARRNAIRLLEATNLLLMSGRHVAKHGDKATDPKIELRPEQIENLIADDRQAWIGFAHGLYDAVVPALDAIDARNADGLMDAGEKIDTACENCHLRYWYPNSARGTAATNR